eukprot:3881336-Alexandrium_andersonii.AAC.1
MLDGVCAAHARPPTRGAPRMQAPREVGVHVDTEGSPFVSPREVVDAARTRDQVPRQPDQRRP